MPEPDQQNDYDGYLTIGEFAVQTGLTQRALRLYAERRILEPASIDPVNGYRRYGPGQVRTGHLIRALRDASVPMSALVDLDDFSIAEHRDRLLRQRIEEDQALAVASAIDAFEAADWPVLQALADPQPWAGLQVMEDLGDDESGETLLDALSDPDVANRCFAVLFSELTARGNRPTGAFWTAMDEGNRAGTVSLSLCWPVADDPRRGDWAGLVTAVTGRTSGQLPMAPTVVAGVLPHRRELSCRQGAVTEGTDPAAIAMAGMGPALALQEYQTAHSEVPVSRALRQRGVLDDDWQAVGQEWVLDVRPQ